MRSTADHSAGGCDVVFEKLKVCDKTFEAIHFQEPDFPITDISHCVITFRSITELYFVNGF